MPNNSKVGGRPLTGRTRRRARAFKSRSLSAALTPSPSNTSPTRASRIWPYLLSPNKTDSISNGSIGVPTMASKAIGLAEDDLIGEKESGAAVLELVQEHAAIEVAEFA